MNEILNHADKALLKQVLQLSTGSLTHYENLEKYIYFLLLKNKELNLMSRKLEITTIINDHIYDCLAAAGYFKDYSTITDIGTGGGLPGILLAIIFPGKKITLVEKSPKKAQFLNQVTEYIGLTNVTIHNVLVNEHEYDSEIITCRAFKPINVILDLTPHFFKQGKKYILYKGKKTKILEEIRAAKKFKFTYEISQLTEFQDKERHIVILQKK